MLLKSRSAFIDFARIAAALTVALAHLRYSMLPEYKAVTDHPLWFSILAFCSGFASDAVILFFVISGWLVGGSLLDSRHKATPYSDYALARACRLGTVLVPAFVIHLAAHAAIYRSMSPPFDLQTLIGNLFGLQTVIVDCFGGNFPLWSLANETAYYVGFVLVVASFDRRFTPTARVSLIVALNLYWLVLTPQIRLYSAIWLFGVLASRLQRKVDWRIAPAVLVALLAWVSAKRFMDVSTGFVPDAVTAVLFGLVLIFMAEEGLPAIQTRFWAFLGSFSFSLYVTHIPVLQLMRVGDLKDTTHVRTGDLVTFLLYAGLILIVAIAFSMAFEQRYLWLRSFVRARLPGRAPLRRTVGV